MKISRTGVSSAKADVPPVIRDYIEENKKRVDEALNKYLPGEDVFPRSIHKAMRYAVFSGGKRLRAILAIASSQSCGGNMGDVMPSACAIEIIHSYSLIHDDLPAMDNDDYRRGKPSCHKKFGEAIGILTGDALLTLGFQLLAKGRDSETNILRIREITRAIGSTGMIGGQVVDMEEKGKNDTGLAVLEYINTHKTGALIAASVKIGAIGTTADDRKIKSIFRFGQYIGLAFQIVDDVIDNDGYAQYFGAKGAMDEAARITEEAKYELRNFGKKADSLRGIADFILNRKR